MKRATRIFWLPGIIMLVLSAAFAAEVLTNESVVAMVKAGLGEEVIVGKIKISQHQFDLSTQALLDLKSQGISEVIIKAMVEASAPPAPPEAKTAEAITRETQDAIALYRQGKVVEAAAAFDKLIAEKPSDDELKTWKALALLEQARGAKDAKASEYKPLVVSAYRILQPLGRRQVANADWNFAMAKAFWMNDRPTWAKRAAEKALALRPSSAEAQLLLGDLAYDDVVTAATAGGPRDATARWFAGPTVRSAYEKALALPDLSAALRAEGFYKLGVVWAELDNKKETAREYWERAVAADPASRYGMLAQEKLKVVGK